MTTVESSDDVDRIVRMIAPHYGFENATGQFEVYRDLKVTWWKGGVAVSMYVSDYVCGAQECVVMDLIDTAFRRMKDGDTVPYSSETCEYLNSDEFLDRNQSTYIGRLNVEELISMDENRRSVERLVETGLLSRDDHLRIYTDLGFKGTRAGAVSPVMHVVRLNPRTMHLSDRALDFVIYKLVAHIEAGLLCDKAVVQSMLDDFDGREEAEAEMQAAGIHL